jgi:hypothetical protein
MQHFSLPSFYTFLANVGIWDNNNNNNNLFYLSATQKYSATAT